MQIGAFDADRREIGVPSFARHWTNVYSRASTVADVIARMGCRMRMQQRMHVQQMQAMRDDDE